MLLDFKESGLWEIGSGNFWPACVGIFFSVMFGFCSHRNFVVWVLHSHVGCALGPPTVACGLEAVSRRFDNQFLSTRNVDFSRQRAATLRTAGMRAHHRRCCKPLPMRAVLYSHRCWISKTWSCAGCQMKSCIGCCLLTLQQARVKTNAPVGALIRSWLSGFNDLE